MLLLPTEQVLLRRAALTVRDAVRAVAVRAGKSVSVIECGYGNDQVVPAYTRCVTDDVDAVIGPLGRSEVTALLSAKLDATKPTLMLSPSGVNPPDEFYVLAPDLESEAEAIAKQTLDDACRKIVLIDAGGALATRIVVAIQSYYRATGASVSLLLHELGSAGARDRWQRTGEAWRKEGIDCALFAGTSATLIDFRPYLRNVAIYATSASYEAELERVVDWTGVRVADAPFVLDQNRSDVSVFAPREPLSPTLARLYALGLDAARIMFDAALNHNASVAPAPSAGSVSPFLISGMSFDGAIGRLKLQQQQFIRTPSIGEFLGRTPTLIGN